MNTKREKKEIRLRFKEGSKLYLYLNGYNQTFQKNISILLSFILVVSLNFFLFFILKLTLNRQTLVISLIGSSILFSIAFILSYLKILIAIRDLKKSYYKNINEKRS